MDTFSLPILNTKPPTWFAVGKLLLQPSSAELWLILSSDLLHYCRGFLYIHTMHYTQCSPAFPDILDSHRQFSKICMQQERYVWAFATSVCNTAAIIIVWSRHIWVLNSNWENLSDILLELVVFNGLWCFDNSSYLSKN